MTAREMARKLGLKELRRSEAAMWRELGRHGRNHGCGDGQGWIGESCPIHTTLLDAWLLAHNTTAAFEWALGLVPAEQLPFTCQIAWSGDFFPETEQVKSARARAAARRAATEKEAA